MRSSEVQLPFDFSCQRFSLTLWLVYQSTDSLVLNKRLFICSHVHVSNIVHLFIRSLVHMFMCRCVHLFISSLIHLFTRSLVYMFTCRYSCVFTCSRFPSKWRWYFSHLPLIQRAHRSSQRFFSRSSCFHSFWRMRHSFFIVLIISTFFIDRAFILFLNFFCDYQVIFLLHCSLALSLSPSLSLSLSLSEL